MLAQRNKNIDIVLLEENLQHRNNISSRLRTQGFSVDAPSGGFHAIKVIEENAVRSIVLCSDMDDMSLKEIATIIRSMNSAQAQVPIYLFPTKVLEPDFPKVMKELKINGHFSPKDFSQLVEALQKLSKL